MNKEYNLKLDLQFRCNNSKMIFDEFDENTSDFFMQIRRQGQEVDISNAIPTLLVLKPSGTAVSQILNIKDNLIYGNLKNSLKDEAGTYVAKLMLVEGDKKTFISNISYEVTENALLGKIDNDIVEDERYSVLIQLIERLSEIELQEESRKQAEQDRQLSEQNREKTIQDIQNKIDEALDKINNIGEGDFSTLATKEELNKLNKELEIHTHEEYATKEEVPTKISELENDKKYLTKIPSEYVTETELNSKGYLTEHQDISHLATKKELFSKDYNDLTNKPTIPSIDGLATKTYVNEEIEKIDVTSQLGDYAKKTDIPVVPTKISAFSNDKGYLTSVPGEYVTETELNNKGYLTEHQDISGKADKTELHSHSNKTVLDNITSAKVTEWNNKSTFDGNYNSLTNKPTIPTVSNDLTNTLKSNYDKAYTHSQSSHAPTNAQKNSDITKAEIEAKLVGNITSHTHSQYLTEHQDLSNYATKEYVRNEIAKIDTSIDIVNSVEEMTDTTKQYVYSGTNTWWRYRKVTISAGGVLPNIDNAIKWSTTEVVLNKRLNSSRAEVDAPGCAIFYFTFNDKMKNILNTVDPVWIRMKGCSMYKTSGNNTDTKVVTWSSSGTNGITATPSSQVLMYEETKDGIKNDPCTPTVNYTNNKTTPVFASKFGYYNTTVSDNSTNKKSTLYTYAIDGKLALSLIVNFASATAITESDLENVYITFNEPIVSYEEQTISEWYDTGIEYNPNDDSLIVELKTRVNDVELKTNDLETRVIKLEKDTPSNNGGNETTTSTLPSYWKNRLDEISLKIDALQKEYGVDAFQFLWASDIHSVPGSAPNDTSNIGNICRYMMDKHNIPFLALSGDIMSQGSHSKVEYVWNEYDKLNAMLSPIRNDEFLATKGNHDGAWGSPVDGVYYLNNIGTKELFNAFYRRQTLDRNRVFGKDGTYFYVDCPNVRFYMLNTHTDGDGSENSDGSAVYNPMKHFVLGNEQLNWIANSLLTVQEGQKVIFMGHAPTRYCLDGSIFENMIASYKNRNSYEGTVNITGQYWGTDEKYSKVSVNKDFANAKGDLVGYFHGHIHKDTISVDGYYPVISITTGGGDLRDDYLVNGTLTRVKGTPTETAIDLVTVTSDYIYLTRIGSGYDRKYNRLTKEITIDYDSAYIPPTEDEENGGDTNDELKPSNLFDINGDGYVAWDGSKMYTNWIPYTTATTGSKLSTVYHIKGGTPYKFQFKYASGSETSLIYCTNANSLANVTSDYSDEVKLFQHDFTDGNGTGFMIRFEIRTDCTENLIIQADKPIGDDGLTQGEITSEVTWIADKRISSSSGGYSDLTGCYASSDIPCKNGDVIRIYGASEWRYYAYVAGYRSDNVFTGVISMETSSTGANDYIEVIKSTDNTLTITVIHDSISYIRVCNKDGLVPSKIRISRNIELQ